MESTVGIGNINNYMDTLWIGSSLIQAPVKLFRSIIPNSKWIVHIVNNESMNAYRFGLGLR